MSRRALAGLIFGLGVLGFGALGPTVVVDNSVGGWLHADRPEVAEYRGFQAAFGTDEVYVITLEAPDAIAAARWAQAVGSILMDDPVIEEVIGPAQVFPDEVDLLLDPDLGGPAALERLGPRLDSPLNRALGLLQVRPPRATVLGLSRVRPPAEREALAARLEGLRGEAGRAGVVLRVAGTPALNLALDRAGRRVQQVALPLLVGVCVVLLLLMTRSAAVTVATLAPVGLAVLCVDGMLGFGGVSANLVVEIARPLIFVLVLASGLHVVVGWQDARRAGADSAAAPWEAARRKGPACALALLTTAVGFASLGLSSLAPIRVFGLLAAGGLSLGIPLVLGLLPALLTVVGGRVAPPPPSRLGDVAAWLVAFAVRRRAAVLVVGAAVVALGALAWPRLATEPHAIRYFDADHPLRRDHEAIEAQGLGLATLELELRAPAPMDEGQLAAVDRVARDLPGLPGVRRVISGPGLLREANVHAGGPDAVPEGSVLEEILAAHPPGLRHFFTADRRALRVALLIGTLDATALDRVEAALRHRFAALPGLELRVTGNYRLLLQAQRTLLDTLTRSLLTTAVLIELIILLVLRSPRLALVAVLPNAIPVAANFALMAALGVPLDVGTCMTAAVALGIAVDDTLHLLVAWRAGADLEAVARSTGRAVLLTSLVIGAGFAVLLTTDFGPTRNFGLLCASAMIAAVLADLLVLPALLGGEGGIDDPESADEAGLQG